MSETQKTKTILFRVSECDHAQLVKAAGQLTLSAYIRAILFNQELPKARAHKKPLKDQEQLSKALGLMMQSRLAPLFCVCGLYGASQIFVASYGLKN